MNTNKRVAVAMSGGVDSSTTAFLLKDRGYEVIGVTGLMHENVSAELSVQRAIEVCKVLDIEHKVVDLKEDFKNKVINYFIDSYKNGLTPNPCAVCNKTIKWGVLRNYAQEVLGAQYYATGHYAQINQENGNYYLSKAGDAKKDQIYMLFSLSQDDLAHTLFPLSGFTKSQVREIARSNNLPCAETPESQDVCFIQPPDTTQNFLIRNLGEKEGNIIDANTNKILKKHKGFFNYTIGQRKGIGVAASEPLYVTSIDPENNSVYVGTKEATYKNSLEINKINWQQEEFSQNSFKSLVKIRYNSPAKIALVIPKEDNSALIEFTEPEFAITSGQVATFYHLETGYLIGGGWIK